MDPSERSAIIRRGRQLEEEHLMHVKRAAILLDAESSWQKVLNASERRDREYVLLALQSKKIPDAVKWGNFDRTFWTAITNDREIFLQRLELDGFEEHYKNTTYSKLPQVFRSDKEIMIKIVSKSYMTLSVASKELQNDRDVVMAALQNPHERAPHSIQYASKKLQGDKRIARTMLSHEYGMTAFTLLPRKLQQDYSLVLWGVQSMGEECKYDALSELPEEMLDDYDIVYEAVKHRGSNLRYVEDESLLSDIDIVMAACENDGAAIEYVPKGPTRDELLDESNLNALLENGGHCVLKELGDEYMMDSKYLIPAVKNGMVLEEEFISKLFEEDHSLFMDVLRHSSKPFVQYNKLPDNLYSDSSVCVAILKTNEHFDEGSWAYRFANDIPEDVVRDHITTLMKFAQDEFIPYNTESTGVWDAKDIAVSLCKINGDNFRRVSSRLKSDVEVVKAACTRSLSVPTMKNVPQTLLRDNHDLAAMVLKACDVRKPNWRTRSDAYNHLGRQVALSRPVFVEWVKKGWPTRYDFGRTIPFADDSSVALEILKGVKDDRHAEDVISEFSLGLRSNKEFMLSAVQCCPVVLKFASPDLLEDFNYMLRGIGISKDALKPFSHKVDKDFDILADFAREVRDRLAVTDGFILEFLGAISISPANRKRSKRRRTGRQPCLLPMLDLGYETGSIIKRTIAEFADIPVGPDIKLLRSALENLKFWGY